MTGRIAESEKTSFVHSEAGVAMGSLVQGRTVRCVMVKRSDWKCELVRLGVSEAWIRCRRGKDGVSAPGKLREIRTRWGTIRKESEVHAKANDAAVNTRNRISMPAPPSRTSILPSKLATRILHTRYATPSPATRHPGHPKLQPFSATTRTHFSRVFGNAIGGACSRSGLRRRERGSVSFDGKLGCEEEAELELFDDKRPTSAKRSRLSRIGSRVRCFARLLRPTFVEVLQKAQTRFVCPRFRQLWNVPKYPSSEGLGGFFGYTESRDRYLV
ncbi:hypothetical protein DFP72DRAFT_845249 [Ephemerocybe angulata]|uniref:Uncharacterized protein n=1 Tax=Ephemerocybe angulata TaxID=980116 RepID=A0A8H6I411_9AGAR|nr:hypothetical protein DFP72DRAFT_845249 [Tulosesus angulatus]